MITTYRYKFTVEWVEDTTRSIERGYVFGATYMDALERLTDMYGEDQIENVYLGLDGENDVIILEDNMNSFNTNWEGPAINGF